MDNVLSGELMAELEKRLGEKGFHRIDSDRSLLFSKSGAGEIVIKVYSDWIDVYGSGYPSFNGGGPRPKTNYRLSLKPRTIAKRIAENIVPRHEEVYAASLARKMFEMSMDDVVKRAEASLGPLAKKIKVRWDDNMSRGEVRYSISFAQGHGSLTLDELTAVAEALKACL
jgi:hypothetical protein